MLTASERLSILTICLDRLRARTPGTPPGDRDEEHEDNTFLLPEGVPLRRRIKEFGKRQLKKILGTIPEIGAPLPHSFPPLTDWDDPMASAMTPLISAYWDEAGQTTRARLGLDPDAWEVHDPYLYKMIQNQTFDFCQATNETTHFELNDALDKLRREFEDGLVKEGETIPELKDRVKSVFQDLNDDRAEMIARTEASRAVHRASMQSAKESGVVIGKRWLAAANSCDRCLELEAKTKEQPIPLDAEFDRQGSHPEYASNTEPPAHPYCRCTVTFVLSQDYAKTVEETQPDSYQPGSLGPDLVVSPEVEKEPEPERPWQPGDPPIDPSLPIGDRIKLATHLDDRVEEISKLHSDLAASRKAKQEIADQILDIQRQMNAKAIDLDKGMKDLSKLEQNQSKAHARVVAAQDQLREASRKMLQLPSGTSEVAWNHKNIEQVGESAKESIQKGQTWFEGKLAGKQEADITWKVRTPDEPQRCVAYPDDRSIKLVDKYVPISAVHEWGHQIEFQVDGVKEAAQEFLDHRVGDQASLRLADLFPDKNYRLDEMGRDDKFGEVFGDSAWYVGKHYKDGWTEIVSMGMETLFASPVDFATKDPEYVKFLMGILDGSLRKL